MIALARDTPPSTGMDMYLKSCRGRDVIIQEKQCWLPQTAGMFQWDDRRCVQSQKHPPHHPFPTCLLVDPHPQGLIPQSEVTGQSRQMARSCLVVKTQQVLRCQKPLHTSSSLTLSLSLTSPPLSAPCKPRPPSPQEGRVGLSRVLLCYQPTPALKWAGTKSGLCLLEAISLVVCVSPR